MISFHQSELLIDAGKVELMFLQYASPSPCMFVRRIKLMDRSCLKINFTKRDYISARSLTDPIHSTVMSASISNQEL